MNDNEIKILNDMINSDKPVEEITKYVNELRGKKKNQEKETYLKQIENIFSQHYKEKKLTPRDAAILSVLVVKDSYPKWTVADMKEYINSMEELIKAMPNFSFKKINFPSRSGDILRELLKMF